MKPAYTYLDHNATAPLRPEALEAMQQALSHPSNPSSVHRYGREAKRMLEDARKTIADVISAWPNEILFTATGTEANHTALKGVVGRRVLVSAIEHSSVLKAAPDAKILPVNAHGVLDLSALDNMLGSGAPALVSVMLANNETGVLQPIREVAALVHAHGGLLHVDAVQGLGKIPVDFGAFGADMLTLSAHKCGGPLGAAALVVRRDMVLAPIFAGGGQELGRRAGTENVAAIAGFAAAATAPYSHMQQVRGWLAAMEKEMQQAGATIIGSDAPRLPNTTCVVMPGVSGETQLMNFDLDGFAVSAGSACSSGRIAPSHVLTAMGLGKDISNSAIRVSAGWNTTEADILRFTQSWLKLAARLGQKHKELAT